MTLIFLVLLIFLPFQSNFTKLNCRDFIANGAWPPIHPTSIHWIIRFTGNAEVITSCNGSQKQFPNLKMHFNWFGLYRRNQLTTLWMTTTSDCRHVCQPTVDIMNIQCENSSNRYW